MASPNYRRCVSNWNSAGPFPFCARASWVRSTPRPNRLTKPNAFVSPGRPVIVHADDQIAGQTVIGHVIGERRDRLGKPVGVFDGNILFSHRGMPKAVGGEQNTVTNPGRTFSDCFQHFRP